MLLVLLLGGLLGLVQPGDGLVNLRLELLLVGGIKFLVNLGIGEGVLQGVGVGLKGILGTNTSGLGLILDLVLLGLGQHALDILLGETALVVGDDDLVGLSGALLESGDVHDTVGINIEGDLDLRNATWCRWDASELELAQKVVVLGALTLTLEDLDEDTWLVVGEGGEDLGLLGWDGGVAGNERSHDTTSGLNTQGKWSNIQEKNLVGGLGRGVSGENGSLDGSTVGNGLIGVDGLVWLLSVEVVGDELLDSWDTGGATDEDDLVDLGLVELGVSEDTVDWLDGGAEKILAELLKTGTGDGGVEIDTLVQRVDLNGGLGGRREGTLGTLAGSAETTKGTGVGGEIL